MKHTLNATIILLSIFLLTQVFGLFTVSNYLEVYEKDGKLSIGYPNTALGEAPVVQEKSWTFVYIFIGILVGTALLFFFIKLKVGSFWRYWFFLSVCVAMTISFGVYFGGIIGFVIALILSILKIYKPNFYTHNLSEIFIYTGIVVLFLPIINLFSACLLLIFISIYDYIAVFKSKHMITLAKFQTESKVFAGLSIPYKIKKDKAVKIHETPSKEIKSESFKKESSSKKEGRVAILGGGDVAFPLIFSSAAMIYLIEVMQIAKSTALIYSYIISITATISLYVLLYYGKKDKFYPAMPVISAGCFIGLGLIYLIRLLSF